MKKILLKKSVYALMALVLSVAFISSCRTGEGMASSPLMLDVKAGKEFKTLVTIDSKITQNMMGMKNNITSKISMGLTQKISAVESDGSHWIDLTYNSITFNMDALGQSLNFDSSDPSTHSEITKAFNALVGKGFSIKTDKKGKVTDVKGAEAFMQQLMQEIGGDAGMNAAMGQSMKQSFGEKALKEMMQTSLAFFPESDSVAVGDSWETTTEAKAQYPMTMKNTWTMTDRNDKLIFLDVDTDIESGSQTIEREGVSVNMSVSGTQTGKMELDAKSAWPIRSSMTQNLNIESEAMGMKIPMTVRSKITIEPVK